MPEARLRALTLAVMVAFAASIAVPALAADGDVVTYGAASTPSWHVTVDDGDLSTLESWTNSSDDRDILRTHNDSNYALVKAPTADAGEGFLQRVLNTGLAHKDYVVEVHPNLQHSLAEPVTLQNRSDVAPPGGLRGTLADVRGGDWSPKGIAYQSDANLSTPSDVRSTVGVDNVSVTGSGATIAVIDTGVNTANGAVFGNGSDGSDLRLLNASKDFIENETIADNGTDALDDPNGHGTWVASAAAANTSNATYDGVAPDADILALRALDADGSGSAGDIAAAVRYAADNDADVIVMSLGSPVYDPALTDALAYAIEHNVSAIAIAAGNSRQTTRWLSSPADAPLDGVAAVSASNTTGNGSAAVAYFANVGGDPGVDGSFGATAGETVTVAAPGMRLEARTPTTAGGTENTTLSGTSMAAPQVAGVAALGVANSEPWIDDPAGFVATLRDTARPMPHAAQAEAGAGLVAADRLLDNTTDGSQSAAMTDTAAARDAYWGSYGRVADLLYSETVDRVLG